LGDHQWYATTGTEHCSEGTETGSSLVQDNFAPDRWTDTVWTALDSPSRPGVAGVLVNSHDGGGDLLIDVDLFL